MKRSSTRTLALPGVLIALAFVLGWLESMLPSFTGIPGVKAGFANIVTMMALFLPVSGRRLSNPNHLDTDFITDRQPPVQGGDILRKNAAVSSGSDVFSDSKPPSRYNTVEKTVCTQSTFLPALAISVVRVLLAGITYNGLSASLYGLTGAVASLLVMHLLKRAGLFSITAISVAGGVTHNAAQLALACLILGSAVFYYLPWLIISGLVSGAAIGLLSALLVRKLKKTISRLEK